MNNVIFVFLFFLFGQIYCQVNPLDFFPHHQGDIWEYITPNGAILRTEIIQDSLGDDGRYYIRNTGNAFFNNVIFDTLNAEVFVKNYPIQGLNGKWYKLDAQVGDSWTVAQDSINVYSANLFDAHFQSNFGYVTMVKAIAYYEKPVGFPDSLLFAVDEIAEGFGFIGSIPEFGPPHDKLIRGAKIDGIIYGNLTSIKDDKGFISEDFTLYSNFPNPFNSRTQITYDLPTAGIVTLKIYDELGKEITTIVNMNQSPGSYSVNFDASNLPSGIYFYVLKVNGISKTRKMTLVN